MFPWESDDIPAFFLHTVCYVHGQLCIISLSCSFPFTLFNSPLIPSEISVPPDQVKMVRKLIQSMIDPAFLWYGRARWLTFLLIAVVHREARDDGSRRGCGLFDLCFLWSRRLLVFHVWFPTVIMVQWVEWVRWLVSGWPGKRMMVIPLLSLFWQLASYSAMVAILFASHFSAVSLWLLIPGPFTGFILIAIIVLGLFLSLKSHITKQYMSVSSFLPGSYWIRYLFVLASVAAMPMNNDLRLV